MKTPRKTWTVMRRIVPRGAWRLSLRGPKKAASRRFHKVIRELEFELGAVKLVAPDKGCIAYFHNGGGRYRAPEIRKWSEGGRDADEGRR